MGAWGHEPFANDSALDWTAELCNSTDESAIIAAFAAVIEYDHSIEVDESSAALAAAEVVAAIKGKPPRDFPENVTSWIAQHHVQADASLVAHALQATARVELSSELQELWEESDEYDLWRGTIQDLRTRLEA